MVQLLGAWGHLSGKLQPHLTHPDNPSAIEVILNALKLAVRSLQSIPPRRDGRTPVERSIDLAATLADLCSCGLPLDADCIAAGIVAEAVELQYLNIRTVSAKLGPAVAVLVTDILEVRRAPETVELYDDVSSR